MVMRLGVCLALVAGTGLLSIDAAAQNSGARAPRTLNVLFVGDSYTYVNNLGDMLAGIAAGIRGGPAIAPTLAARGGVPLGWHLANGPALMLIAERQWDHVVLQEHSLLGGYIIDGEPRMMPPRLFHESARQLVQRVRDRKAAPIFLMTWPRRGREAIEEPILTNAYLDIGRELNVPVAAVGTAFKEVASRQLGVDLLARDGGHPSPAGTYLAACLLYASMTGRSPVGAPAIIQGHPYSRNGDNVDSTRQVTLAELTPAIAAQLQQLAWELASSPQR